MVLVYATNQSQRERERERYLLR